MIDRIDFRDANSMRLLGFGAHALRLAGFSDIDVLTAGYTAAELRDASFTAEELREAGLAESTLRVVGFQLEQQVRWLLCLHYSLPCVLSHPSMHPSIWLLLLLLLQMDALVALFQCTRGDRWKDCSGWRAFLQQPLHRVAAADTDKRSSSSSWSSSSSSSSPPCGLVMDRSTKEVVKIQLCANNLSGQVRLGVCLVCQLLFYNN